MTWGDKPCAGEEAEAVTSASFFPIRSYSGFGS